MSACGAHVVWCTRTKGGGETSWLNRGRRERALACVEPGGARRDPPAVPGRRRTLRLRLLRAPPALNRKRKILGLSRAQGWATHIITAWLGEVCLCASTGDTHRGCSCDGHFISALAAFLQRQPSCRQLCPQRCPFRLVRFEAHRRRGAIITQNVSLPLERRAIGQLVVNRLRVRERRKTVTTKRKGKAVAREKGWKEGPSFRSTALHQPSGEAPARGSMRRAWPCKHRWGKAAAEAELRH